MTEDFILSFIRTYLYIYMYTQKTSVYYEDAFLTQSFEFRLLLKTARKALCANRVNVKRAL